MKENSRNLYLYTYIQYKNTTTLPILYDIIMPFSFSLQKTEGENELKAIMITRPIFSFCFLI